MAAHLIDTHAHLGAPVFDADRAQVIERAAKEGIASILLAGETMEDARRNLELAAEYPALRPMAGLYPEFADIGEVERMIDFIRVHSRELCGIGEVGLDFWIAKEEPDREVQREVFRRFILLGRELGLPVNVHSRSAGRHAVKMLLENTASRVQLHAFDGKYSAALPAVEAGYFFSVPPSIIRSRQKQKLVKNLPLSCLLLESDSPVLGPDADERNEPANIPIVIDAIAEIKDVPTEEVREYALDNTRRLYKQL